MIFLSSVVLRRFTFAANPRQNATGAGVDTGPAIGTAWEQRVNSENFFLASNNSSARMLSKSYHYAGDEHYSQSYVNAHPGWLNAL